jgi:uncharacterized delta-60 repeat protein
MSAATMLLLIGSAAAAPGDLDLSFGTRGVAEAEIGSAAVAEGMALQPDGKIVLAGNSYPFGVALARFMPDGQLDGLFGSGGTVAGPDGSAFAVASQADGKLVVSAWAGDGLMSVIRYRLDGSVDSAFGSGGIASGPQGDPRAIAVQTDAKIVVAGTSVGPDVSLFTLLRFEPDGTPDAGFGSDGIVRTRIGEGSGVWSIALQPDGKIVAAGWSTHSNEQVMTLARYETDGRLDSTFGSGGVAQTTAGGAFSSAASVILQPDGRIVAAGSVFPKLAVARFLPDGTPDASFGSGGATTTGTGGIAGAFALALQADGRLVVAGSGPSVFTLLRFRADGTLDAEFGEEGISRSAIGLRADARAIAVEPGGQILAAGYSSGTSYTRFALARYRVSTPTTIGLAPLVVPYGTAIRVSGRASDAQPGARVTIKARGCYAYSSTRAASTIEGPSGDWSARVTPRTQTGYRAEIDGDRSLSVSVQVRPRLTVRRLSRSRVRTRALYGYSLAGETIVLQRLRRAAGQWVDIRLDSLRPVGRTRAGVVSGVTVKLRRRSAPIRALLRQPNPYACFAESVSRTMSG